MPSPVILRLLKLKRLILSRRGAILPIAAGAIPAVLGLAGLGVETGLWQADRVALQVAADAAASSAVIERARYGNNTLMSAAMREAGRNGFTTVQDITLNNRPTVALNNPPLTGARAGDNTAVEVVLTRPQRTVLASLFTSREITISARSVAAMQTSGQACVLALDPSAAAAVKNTGSASINLAGCWITANSNSTTAVDLSGSSSLIAQSIWSAGGYTTGGSANVTFAATPVTYGWTIPDPYASTAMPAIGSCLRNNLRVGSGPTTLQPGVYCNGIDVGSHAVVTFEPGVYVINRGDFKVNGQATLRCNCPNASDGVTFILTSSSNASQIGNVDINGGADIQLRAPSGASATYRGLLFVQDRLAPYSNSGSNTNKFLGGASMVLTGSIYFPSQEVQWSGNSTSTSCIEIVARTVKFTGNTRLDASGCVAAGVQNAQLSAAKLVE